MSQKIVAFGASNSSQSINKQLATYAAHQIEGAEVQVLDLNDFEMPIYSMDREKAAGVPEAAAAFKQHLQGADGIVLSMAEHNGAYTAAFKNIFDWMSRLEGKVWENKPLFVLSTSPGGRGGQSVLQLAVKSFPFMGAKEIASFSLPQFGANFSADQGITNAELKAKFEEQLSAFVASLG
ncbi:MAG: NAD(P)H-dependent oxidoreductase [Bacteroidota bacterium]